MTRRIPAPQPSAAHYDLRLFVAGHSGRSGRAVCRVKELCESYLKGRYSLRVVDLYQQPELAARDQIVATPTLLRSRPTPRRLLVGEVETDRRFLEALGLPAEKTS